MTNVALPLPLNHIQISSLLSLCGKEKNHVLGSSIHAAIFKFSNLFSNQNITILWNALISMYSKCGYLSEATWVFSQMLYKDTVSWNSIVSGHFMNHDLCRGFGYFKKMRNFGCRSDHATMTTVLSICSKPELRYACDMMHCVTISNGFMEMVPVGNALLTAYFKCGSPSSARRVFDGMLDRNVITWTAMVSGMAQSESFEKSLVLFQQMRRVEEANSLTYSSSLLACSGLRALREGQQIHGLVTKSGFVLDLCVEGALMDMYSKCGVIKDADFIFQACRGPDKVSLTVMLAGFAQNGLEENALQLFAEMIRNGTEIDANMVSAVLGAFGASATFSLGKQIHALVIKKCLGQNVVVCNGLINMYSKCGELRDSTEIFESMTERNAVSWNSMIAAFARHGHGSEALKLYENMELEGVKPTGVTYVSLLHACSHVGEIKKGVEFLASMSSVHGVTPRSEHYSCVVDMLGRAGHLKEAKEFIEGLSIKPKALLWQALLGTCCIHCDLDTGKYAAERLVLEEPDSPSAYVLLANIHSLKGRWDGRARVAKKMKEMGVKKVTGMSWIEIEKKVHSFVVEDTASPQCEAIYEVLGELMALIRKEDVLHDENSILHGLEL